MTAADDFVASEMAEHELQAVDRNGEWCSCGTVDHSWLEHLADVALNLMGAPRTRTKPITRREETAWLIRQQHDPNIAPFRTDPRWVTPESRTA